MTEPTPEREAELKQERMTKAAALSAESALCERVARYLMEKAGYPWETNDDVIRHIWLNDAKHVIKLVREARPTTASGEIINRIERLAFALTPPNTTTPQIVQACVELRAALALPRSPAPPETK